MIASVIFTTYKHPKWLEKTLWGFSAQSYRDFEKIVADDGSETETRAVVNSLRAQIDIPIQHVWQEDDGFQKCRVMNKAIVASRGEYLIFTDGDCIPHPDFDERMQYGGQDREFGERLINMGLQTRQVRYRCSCVHLDHGRGYARPESIAKNRAIRKRTRDNRITRTDFGIESAAQNDLAAR